MSDKMNIQWFPGHMAKARREVEEKLKYIDLVLELLDARIPISSRNPMLDSIIQKKPRLILLNKCDLADPQQTIKWKAYFQQQGQFVLTIDAKTGKGIKEIASMAAEILAEKRAKQKARGMKEQPIRAMCIGIPNVGKSTLLNRMVNKKIAKTGNKPGVTKGQQWLKTGKNFELLDTPGILWPKFEDPKIGAHLALTGAIKDTLLTLDELALMGLEFLKKYYPLALQNRYELTTTEMNLNSVDILLIITKKRGFQDDYERASEMFIRELRDGKLGRYTLDQFSELESLEEQEQHE